MQASGKLPDTRLDLGVGAQRVDIDAPAAALQGGFYRFQHTRTFSVGETKAVRHHVQHFALDGRSGSSFGFRLFAVFVLASRAGNLRRNLDLALGLHPRIPADRQPLRDLISRGVHRQLDRKSHDQTRILRPGKFHQLRVNRVGRVVPHQLCRITVE